MTTKRINNTRTWHLSASAVTKMSNQGQKSDIPYHLIEASKNDPIYAFKTNKDFRDYVVRFALNYNEGNRKPVRELLKHSMVKDYLRYLNGADKH